MGLNHVFRWRLLTNTVERLCGDVSGSITTGGDAHRVAKLIGADLVHMHSVELVSELYSLYGESSFSGPVILANSAAGRHN